MKKLCVFIGMLITLSINAFSQGLENYNFDESQTIGSFLIILSILSALLWLAFIVFIIIKLNSIDYHLKLISKNIGKYKDNSLQSSNVKSRNYCSSCNKIYNDNHKNCPVCGKGLTSIQ